MNQSIINYTGEKYSIWKRLAIFVIDGLISLGIFLTLFFTLGTFSVKAIAVNSIDEMNNCAVQVYEREKIDYKKEGQFNLVEIDYDKFMDKEIANGKNVEQAMDNYYKVKGELEKELSTDMRYKEAYSKFYATYISTVVTSMLIPLFIFELLIPILNKKHQTLTMMMFRAGLVDTTSNVIISNVKILLRFLIIFTTEFLVVYLLINWIGIFFVILVTFCLISFTNNRATIHDLILKVKITDIDNCHLE